MPASRDPALAVAEHSTTLHWSGYYCDSAQHILISFPPRFLILSNLQIQCNHIKILRVYTDFKSACGRQRTLGQPRHMCGLTLAEYP